MSKALKGIHHVTAMTDDVERNYKFFTEVLGMRLVKKTVNQDDIQTYHTFYADDIGNPGTDMTFFDFHQGGKGRRGTNEISRIGLRVPDDAALEYYKERFEEYDVKHEEIEEFLGKKILKFEEEDGQRYQLFSDENDDGVEPGTPWKDSPVPQDKAIYGLGPIEITVEYFEQFRAIMEQIYDFRVDKEFPDGVLLEVGKGGNGGQMILRRDTESDTAMPGDGQVHHVSFRVDDIEALEEWLDVYKELGIGNSGVVERFYFKALYARIGHILIELSTDGPGFTGDEPYETLGESLALPPYLEPKRDYIESVIKPFDTSRD